MAGTLKQKLPKNVEIVRVPCAGRIETIYLLKALEKGADGVLVFACFEENCQFLRGNLRAKGRLSYAHRMLEKIGLEKEAILFRGWAVLADRDMEDYDAYLKVEDSRPWLLATSKPSLFLTIERK
jgi:coenzyme F420-reducing hydrogenase delta subunit